MTILKNILITGGSGFLGRALINRLLQQNPNAAIKVLAREESKLLTLRSEFGVEIIPGDVTRYRDVAKAMKDVDTVFHAAGFKHLPLAETESEQAIRTNVLGSLNVLKASAEEKPSLVLATSTDKAYNPINAYGMTKRLMEYLFAQYQRDFGAFTDYRIVRYGNVLGSTGSVLGVWRKAVERGEPIRVTDPDMTRFFFRVEDAVQTIFDCIAQSKDATPFIPVMKAVRMGDLAEVCKVIFLEKLGKVATIEIVGLRPGEKTSEGMADDIQSDTAEQYTRDEIYELVKGIV